MSTNPLLQKLRIPGETFRLPSCGIFYTNGELSNDVVNGEVEVHPMTARDEIILNTPDKLLSGKAISEIFTNCIPQIKKPMDLLSKDVDFLMVCLRMATFGQFMEVSYQHTCSSAKLHQYDVDVLKMLRDTKSIDPTSVTNQFAVTTEQGQVVKLRPLAYGALLDLYRVSSLNKSGDMSKEESELLVIDALTHIIQSVDQTTDRGHIREWVASISLKEKRAIEQVAQDVSKWGIEFTSRHVCKDCHESVDLQISANPVNFFS